MPKKLYERGPAMDPPRPDTGKRMFEGPSLQQIDQAKRGARTPEAIDKSRDMIRNRVVAPPQSGSRNGPPIKTKFE